MSEIELEEIKQSLIYAYKRAEDKQIMKAQQDSIDRYFATLGISSDDITNS